MSIFNVLESNIGKSVENYSDYLSDLKGKILKGSEFMFFALSNIFRDKEIDNIEKGIVDSSYRGESYDFGIDAIFITGANEFIETPDELEEYNEDTKFKIQVFQFKRGTGISQADLLKLNSGLKKVLVDEKIKDSDNLYFYNRMKVISEIKNLIYTNFSSDNIEVIIHVVFGGLQSNVYSETILTDEIVKIQNLLKDNGFVNTKFVITDCENLINAPSKSEQIVDIIEYQKTFKYITEADSRNKLNGYISIVNGKDIAELVRKHQSAIFEANIRDFYKKNDTNVKITETSASEKEAKFFWSYNNGLTMTCSKVEEMPNNKYKLHDLQIVNGCQTSNAIYVALKNRERVSALKGKLDHGESLSAKEQEELRKKEKLQFKDSTSLLVKIIETKNNDFIYKITETTNTQTPIKVFSLKANDNIQKLIEKYLDNNDICYERRINYMRNKGKKNIYSIQKLFQLYTSQILFKPSQVKTKPKAMFVTMYDDVFPASEVKVVNYLLYLIPIKVDLALNKGLKEYLKDNTSIDSYQRTLISYSKFHLGCFILSSILLDEYNEKGIIKNETKILDELENNFRQHLDDALENFERILKSYAGTKKEAIESAVRKAELDAKIVRFIKSRK